MASQDGGIQFAFVPLDNEALKATPVPDDAEQVIFSAPSAPNVAVDVLAIWVSGTQLVVDAADPVTVNLVYTDASADSDTTLLTGAAGALGDLKAAGGLTVNEALTLWHGTQRLDPGDQIRAVLSIVTPTTAGEGYTFGVAYRVAEWGGQ